MVLVTQPNDLFTSVLTLYPALTLTLMLFLVLMISI